MPKKMEEKMKEDEREFVFTSFGEVVLSQMCSLEDDLDFIYAEIGGLRWLEKTRGLTLEGQKKLVELEKRLAEIVNIISFCEKMKGG